MSCKSARRGGGRLSKRTEEDGKDSFPLREARELRAGERGTVQSFLPLLLSEPRENQLKGGNRHGQKSRNKRVFHQGQP